MSREIKFRAWDIKDKRFASLSNMCSLVLRLNGSLTEGSVVVSDNYVLEQYIGLPDKRDNDLYEGDLCIADGFEKNVIHEIIFHEGAFCTRVEGNPYLHNINMFYPPGDCILSKIGNIHENPELLEVQE